MYPVPNDIPLTKGSVNRKYSQEWMKVGDSVYVLNKDRPLTVLGAIRSWGACQWPRRYFWTIRDADGLRIWRVK